MLDMKKAESRLGDPEITKMMVRFQRRISGYVLHEDGMERLAEADVGE